MSDFDIDSILDSALDEFDRKEPARPAQPSPPPAAILPINQSTNQSANPSSSQSSHASPPDLSALLAALSSVDMPSESGDESFNMKEFSRAFAALAGGDGSGEPDLNQLAQMLEQAAKAEAAQQSSQSTSSQPTSSQPTTAPAPAPAGEENLDFKDSVNRALRMINEQAGASNNQSSSASGMDAGMDEMLSKLLAEFQGNESGEPSDILEKMMSHMLGREYLAQPMKDIANSYPAWIEERRASLSEEDLKNYNNQYQCFRRIVAVYDEKRSSEDESKAVMEIMNEMQHYGTPPEELVRDMLPPNALAGMTGSDSSTAATGGMPEFDENMISEMLKGLGGGSGGPPDECRTQ